MEKEPPSTDQLSVTSDLDAVSQFANTQLKSNLSYREKMDVALRIFPIKNYRGTDKLSIEFDQISPIIDIAEGFEWVKPRLEEIFGPYNSGVSVNAGLSGAALNIPAHHLATLSEEQCQQVLEIMAKMIGRELELREENRQLNELVAGNYYISRSQWKNTPKIYEFDISTHGCDKTYGVTPSHRSNHTVKEEHNTYRPLQHMAKCLNEVLGEKMFKYYPSRSWGDGRLVPIYINEDDADRLLHHPKLDQIKAIFADPLAHCLAYEKSTAFGSLKHKVGLGYKSNVPALEIKTPPRPEDLSLPLHPADAREGKPTFGESIRRSFNGISNGLG